VALAVNIVALIIVLGLCWTATMWLSGRSHGHRPTTVEVDGIGDLTMSMATGDPCSSCEGVGAYQKGGRLWPCNECFGTGVLS